MNQRRSPATKAHPLCIIEGIVKDVTKLAGISATESAPGSPRIFFHVPGRRPPSSIYPNQVVELQIVFTGMDADLPQKWRDSLGPLLQDPAKGANFSLVSCGEVEQRSFDMLEAERAFGKTEGEICLEFLTPVPFNPEKKKRRMILSKAGFVDLFLKRFARLFGRRFAYDPSSEDFALLPYYWNYHEIQHASGSEPGSTQFINGCSGNLYLRKSFRNFLPYLILGTELHAGQTYSNGQGYYRLQEDAPGFFCRFFPDRRALVNVIRDVVNRHDHAAESLAEDEGLPLDEMKVASSLAESLRSENYPTSPNTAFLIRKKEGGERLIEHPCARDMIVQQYLQEVLSGIAERMFEEQSIGFRKGVSRKAAIGMIHDAVAAGCNFVLKADIEDFFPSVDHSILFGLLRFYIPSKDAVFLSALVRSVAAGYVLNGSLHERTKGIAQGSPLSPLLANLYLDSFDEAVASEGIRLIRYADDFLILTKTREDAERLAKEAGGILGRLGLRLSDGKTNILPIADGFQFLGIAFGGGEAHEQDEDAVRLLRKPVYVTEPHLFLGVNGEALEVRRARELVEMLPLRGISEIMMMERASFSTALITKCIEHDVRVTIALRSGYDVITLLPFSKKEFALAADHAARFGALGTGERLAVAKDIATAKLENYCSWYRQRYEPGRNNILRALEEYCRRICSAADVDEVRGLEGAAAKLSFAEMAGMVKDPAFRIGKRMRVRPDRINSMLNFTYYLLFARINAAARALGLNPYLGFLHSEENDYESLVSDLVEPFRANADRFVVKLINLNIITPQDFVETSDGFYLAPEGRRKYLAQFESEMEKKSPGQLLSLKETMYVQARNIRDWALNGRSLFFYRWEK